MTYGSWSHHYMTNPSLAQNGYSRTNWTRMVRLCAIKQVFVKQSPSFENDTFPNHVFKLKKGTLWTQVSTSCLV
ncbi:hypothetical protein CR513_45555, partial [Mucuna pruriens]